MRAKQVKKVEPTYPADWAVATHLHHHGRHVTPGMELSFKGERGRYRFVNYVVNTATDKEWVNVVGGPRNVSRSFYLDKIKTVHRLTKLRPGK